MKELDRAGSDVVNDLCIAGDGRFSFSISKKKIVL